MFSYAEIARCFERIIGVTGTLKSLSDTQQQVLDEYGISHKTYIPSLYGQSRREFQKDRDTKIVDDPREYYVELANEIKGGLKSDCSRAVIAFFETKEQLDAFKSAPEFASYAVDAHTLTAESGQKERAHNQDGHASWYGDALHS